jgi:hypothetical protein
MQFQATEDIRICHDCVIMVANGDCLKCIALDTNTRRGAPKECPHGEMPDRWEGWDIALGGEDDGFSWSACEYCGDQDGGDRYTATMFMMTAEHWVRQGRALTEVARLARERPSAYTGDQHPAALLDRAAEYVRLAVNARRYATEHLSGTSS